METRRQKIRQLNRFALPLLIQSVASYFMGVADTAILARLSVDAFNASSLVSSTLYMIAGVLGSITITLNIRLGKKIGEKDKEGATFEFFTSAVLSLLIGIAFQLLLLFGGRTLLSLLYGLQGTALEEGMRYTVPMSFYMPIQLLLFAFGTLFRVRNETKWVLYGSVLGSVVNLVLDVFFVLGAFGFPKLGVAMAGWSTTIGLSLNLLLYVVVAKPDLSSVRRRTKELGKNILGHIGESLVLGLQEIIDGSVFILGVNMIVIRIGKFEYAGLSIIQALLGFLYIFKHIYGSAVLSLTSRDFGEKKTFREIQGYPRCAAGIATGCFLIAAVLFWKEADFFTRLISDNPSALEIASSALLYFLLANIFSSSTYVYQSALQSVESSKYVLYTTGAMNLVTLGIMFLVSALLKWGLPGIALAYFVNETGSYLLYRQKFQSLLRARDTNLLSVEK